jgi:hypothetical protein
VRINQVFLVFGFCVSHSLSHNQQPYFWDAALAEIYEIPFQAHFLFQKFWLVSITQSLHVKEL